MGTASGVPRAALAAQLRNTCCTNWKHLAVEYMGSASAYIGQDINMGGFAPVILKCWAAGLQIWPVRHCQMHASILPITLWLSKGKFWWDGCFTCIRIFCKAEDSHHHVCFSQSFHAIAFVYDIGLPESTILLDKNLRTWIAMSSVLKNVACHAPIDCIAGCPYTHQSVCLSLLGCTPRTWPRSLGIWPLGLQQGCRSLNFQEISPLLRNMSGWGFPSLRGIVYQQLDCTTDRTAGIKACFKDLVIGCLKGIALILSRCLLH